MPYSLDLAAGRWYLFEIFNDGRTVNPRLLVLSATCYLLVTVIVDLTTSECVPKHVPVLSKHLRQTLSYHLNSVHSQRNVQLNKTKTAYFTRGLRPTVK